MNWYMKREPSANSVAARQIQQELEAFSERLRAYARTEAGQRSAQAAWDYYWEHGHFMSDPCNCRKKTA